MENLETPLLKDRIFTAGLLLIVTSVIVFLATGQLGQQTGMGLFFINYGISLLYLIVVFVTAVVRCKWRLSESRLAYTVLLLILWFISAFALNREMNVFDTSVPWLCVTIVIAVLALLLSLFIHHFNNGVRACLYFLMGFAGLLFTYYAIYLLPLYAISIVGVIAIGISLHTYIPLLLLIVLLVILRRATRQNRLARALFFSGMLLPLIFCGGFLLRWNSVNNQINRILNQHTLTESKLPAWVAVSQQIQPSGVAEKLLKAGLVYHEVNLANDWLWGGIPSRNFNQPRQHDPLVVIATLIFNKPNLDEDDRIKILEAMYDSRYQTLDRLWNGDNLETVGVTSNVKIFPQYRLAYTEKILTIRNNNAPNQWWGNRQEAIYNFHLPEGSVVTSLSLWIDGRETKARLSTKGKADSAYRQVVGVEQHDPSLIHWQEGNTVSVRVFPCMPNQNRQVKIGITSPLLKTGDRLTYQNVYFDGPTAKHAAESLLLSFATKPDALKLPDFIGEPTRGVYHADITYQPYWEISCKAVALSSTAFSFAGSSYAVADYRPAYTHFNPDTIYLDLNSSWTKAEFDTLWSHIKAKQVYVYQDKLISINAQNKDELFTQLAGLNFSMFPVYKIKHTEGALLITKSTAVAPNYKDIEYSEFAEKLTTYLKEPKRINVYNIGTQLSPYLKTLKEMRVFNYTAGDIRGLTTGLNKQQFVQLAENDSTVVLDDAQLAIRKIPSAPAGNAPDHLLRLFAYNDIMTKVGPDYFNKGYVKPELIAEAQQAYVVSPLSSLIVLETEADYRRFGIADSNSSLKNAGMNSSGSVPEPREWMLIVLVIAVVISMVYKRRYTQNYY